MLLASAARPSLYKPQPFELGQPFEDAVDPLGATSAVGRREARRAHLATKQLRDDLQPDRVRENNRETLPFAGRARRNADPPGWARRPLGLAFPHCPLNELMSR